MIIGVVSVILTLIIGITILEFEKENLVEGKGDSGCSIESQKEEQSSTEAGVTSSVKEINSTGVEKVQENCEKQDDIDTMSVVRRKHVPVAASGHCEENERNDESLQTVVSNKRETLCSIQDLLANTSALDELYILNEDTRHIGGNLPLNQSSSNASLCGNRAQSCLSINEIGLPLQENSPAPSSFHSLNEKDSGQMFNPAVIVKDCHALNPNSLETERLSAESRELLASDHNSTQENIKCLSIADAINSSCKNDYESIYDTVPIEEPVSKLKDCASSVTFLSPKTLLLQPIDESIAAQSSGSHDYENIPAANVYRANTGVRHWKTYLDIEDKIHDYSTFKERSEIQDSTLTSNLYGNTLMLTEICNNRPLSMAEKANSNYSISLPDLTNLDTAACFELQKVSVPTNNNENHEENVNDTHKKCSSGTWNSPNYEAIWYEDLGDDGETDSAPRKIAISNGELKESLCNLYYSRVSELSSNYLTSVVKRNNSTISLGPHSDVAKPQLIFEVNGKQEHKTIEDAASSNTLPNGTVTPNTKCRRSDSKRTQKSPLMRLVSLSQNSLHEHTARALQAGRRVFYRPRVHVITPKKGAAENQSFSKAQTTSNYLKIDPNVLRKRAQLSPKDKLILREASALIRKKEVATSECKMALGFPSDEHKSKEVKSAERCDPNAIEDGKEGPQHSTPEGNRHLPQISILSTISSVASPEETVKVDAGLFFGKRSCSSIGDMSTGFKRSFHPFIQGGNRCSSNHLKEMSVIEEFESVPSHV